MSAMAVNDGDALARLLRDCRLVADEPRERPSARSRLEAIIGRDQARLLLTALGSHHGFVRRSGRRRARSSP